jgi:hypothetical protein
MVFTMLFFLNKYTNFYGCFRHGLYFRDMQIPKPIFTFILGLVTVYMAIRCVPPELL